MTELNVQETEVTEETADVAEVPENDDAAVEVQDDHGGEEHQEQTADGELKTVRKALDKRNRYINNQRNRIRALEAEIEKLKEGFGKDSAAAPDMESFDSVIEYMKADQTHTLDQKFAEQAHKGQLAQLEQQKAAVIEQRTVEIATEVNELLSSNEDFKQVVTGNFAVLDQMPEHIEGLMMEIDDAPAATYALLKEGRLQDVYHMPPHIAAAHLVQAEIRGQQYLQQSAPKQTQQHQQQAPKPIGSLKGSGKSTKSYADMSADELAKRFLK